MSGHIPEIIANFHKNDAFLYNKLVSTVVSLNKDTHTEKAVGELLAEFIQTAPLLVQPADQPLTEAILEVSLNVLPAGAIERMCELYVQLVLLRIELLPVVLTRLIAHFDTVHKPPLDTSSTEEAHVNIVNRHVHATLERLVCIIPSLLDSEGVLNRSVCSMYPHPAVPSARLRAYMQNVIVLSTYTPSLAPSLWTKILSNLLLLDSEFSGMKQKLKEQPNKTTTNTTDENILFPMDHDALTPPPSNSSQEADQIELSPYQKQALDKLDECIGDIFCFTDKLHRGVVQVRGVDGCLVQGSVRWLYGVLEDALLHVVLCSQNAVHLPYLWFYCCILDKTLLPCLLDGLWQLVECPSHRASARQTHNAVCFMAALLARGKFADVDLCRSWMDRWQRWLWSYYDECLTAGRNVDGLLMHGTFYAVCHATMMLFNFRCSHFIHTKHIGLDVVRGWNFDRLCNSWLNPLRYVDSQIVQVFASICRCLQLAFCQHVIQKNHRYNLVNNSTEAAAVPFEPTFPFEPYTLPSSSVYIQSEYNEFTLLSDVSCEFTEAVGLYNRAVQKLRERTVSNSAGADDFLVEGTCGSFKDSSPQTAMLNDYTAMHSFGNSPLNHMF